MIDTNVRLIPNIFDGLVGGRGGGQGDGRVGGGRVIGGCNSGRACIGRRVASENGCGARAVLKGPPRIHAMTLRIQHQEQLYRISDSDGGR